MEPLNDRQKEILNLLAWRTDYVSVAVIAKTVNRSVRTTYDDLNSISNWLRLQPVSVSLDKKRTLGVRLVGAVTSYRQPKKQQASVARTASSPEQRQLDIAKRLLLEEEVVTYQRLMDQYFVSSTSVKNDLDKLQAHYQIQLNSTKKGTRAVGNEEQFRKSMFLVAEHLLEIHQLDTSVDFETQGACVFSQLFGESLTYYVFQQVYGLYYGEEYSIPDQYVKSAAIHLLIYLYRLRHQHPLQVANNFLFEQIQCIETYYLASSILSEADEMLQLSFTKNDVEGLNNLLISQGVKIHSADYQQEVHIRRSIETLLKNMREIFSIDFSKDEQLLERLYVHFVPMVYRLRAGISINNPLLEDIKRQYALTFNSVWYALADIEIQLGVPFTDDEVSFLTVYFQVVLEKLDFGKQILIVCPTGIGTSELIINKIRKMLPQKDIVEITTLNQLQTNDLSKVDFVIFSVRLENIEVPVVQVSPLISQADLKNIATLYSEVFLTEPEVEEAILTEQSYLNELLEPAYIFKDKHFVTKEECLQFLIHQLEEADEVTGNFSHDVFEREKLGATSLETGVAIPHASPKNVKHTRICLLTLTEAIIWDEHKVHVVILICIAEQDRKCIRQILSEIYQVVATKEKVQAFVAGI